MATPPAKLSSPRGITPLPQSNRFAILQTLIPDEEDASVMDADTDDGPEKEQLAQDKHT